MVARCFVLHYAFLRELILRKVFFFNYEKLNIMGSANIQNKDTFQERPYTDLIEKHCASENSVSFEVRQV